MNTLQQFLLKIIRSILYSCFISDQTDIQIEFSPNYIQERSHEKNNKLPDPYDKLFDYPIYSAPDNEYTRDLDFESFDMFPQMKMTHIFLNFQIIFLIMI